MRACLFVCALAAGIACDESVTGPTTPLNQEFTLNPGQAAVIEGTGVSVRFDRVSNDSRCPADAVCVLGGDAIVNISLVSSGSTRAYELHTGNMQPVRHNDLTIHLVQLAPYPFSARTIPPQDYRATLRVTR